MHPLLAQSLPTGPLEPREPTWSEQFFLFSLSPFFWLLQLALIFHVYRTGRPYYWIPVLLLMPGVGALAYFVVEILPELRGSRARGFFDSIKPRKWRIADLRTRVEESDTVENRLALAAELFEGGDAAGAYEAASESLHGVFRDDGHTVASVARYQVALGRFDDALALVARVKDLSDRGVARAITLIRADCYTGLGRYADAEEAYQSIADRHIGEAVRAGLARVYAKTGREAESLALWQDIRAKFRKGNPAWRRSEKPWYKLASAEIKLARSGAKR